MLSRIYEDFGITGGEAIKRGIILPGTRLNRTGKLIRDGWEYTRTGNNYPTQYEAVRAWYEEQLRQQFAEKARWQEADLHWYVDREQNTHTLIECATGNILLQTGNRNNIIDYIDKHENLKIAKRVQPFRPEK